MNDNETNSVPANPSISKDNDELGLTKRQLLYYPLMFIFGFVCGVIYIAKPY